MPLLSELARKAYSVDHRVDAMEAARCMRNWHTGALAVLHDGRLVGMVTDRDIAITVISGEFDPEKCPISDCMHTEVISVSKNAGTTDAIELMRHHGIRHLPVIDDAGHLTGMIASDDIIQYLDHELRGLAAVTHRGMAQDGAPGAESPVRLGRE